MCLSDQTILVTGGTGSFGKKFIEIALSEYNPKVIRIFSRDELKQQNMQDQLKKHKKKLRFLIGDVRDQKRLYRAMNGVDIVIHAAALKQVPTCEYNPIEAVKTNIDGAINVIDAAIDNGIKKVMVLSTDKAVYPVNLYGATKLVAEKLFIQANFYAGNRKIKFSCVRYGNVIGSRGSIVPLFLRQKKHGQITITDERMTRFWITQGQAVRFIINCIERMQGGEIFIPKIPSMRVIDLADVIAPDAERKVIGVRPGEKINEVLLVKQEGRHSEEFPEFFVIRPELSIWHPLYKEVGPRFQCLPEEFEYSSSTNRKWLSKEKLQKMLEDL